MNFTQTPESPYYVAIFTTQRNIKPNDGYDKMSEKIGELVKGQPGFIGMESVRDEAGQGITACYWEDLKSIEAWKQNASHQKAQTLGIQEWYKDYYLRIAKVERDYGTV